LVFILVFVIIVMFFVLCEVLMGSECIWK
jgi:hypothetical protein